MKRLTALLLTTAFLCGCGSTESKNESVSEVESTTVEINCYLENDVKAYTSVEEFNNSTFYDNLKKQNINVYDIMYDSERYDLVQIVTDALFYEYQLFDNETQLMVDYTVNYDKTMGNMNELMSIFDGDRNILTTATNNIGTYEVYLVTPSFMEEEDYGLVYLPFENYVVSIYAGNNASSDEILSYFDDFELVAEE